MAHSPQKRPTACLVLADGSVFYGKGFGATGQVTAELCFNTAMTGYQEIMTDPSYAGQVVTFTFPHIGNVGVNPEDDETADPVAEGMVVKWDPTEPSNWRSAERLSDWLARRYGDDRFYMLVPGISVVLGVPFQISAYLSGDINIVMASFAASAFFASVFFGPSFAMAQALATPRNRALSASLLLFIQTMIGLGIGPLLVGAVSDALLAVRGDAALQTALVVVALFNIWSGLHYYIASRTVRRDIEQAKSAA